MAEGAHTRGGRGFTERKEGREGGQWNFCLQTFLRNAKVNTMHIDFIFNKFMRNFSLSVIYVARNASDCLVSFFHFLTKFVGDYEGSFEDFVDLFMKGEVLYGDYWDHIMVIQKHNFPFQLTKRLFQERL